MDFWTISGWLSGIVGLGSTIFFGIENRNLSRKLRSVEWSDILVWSRDLAKQIRKEFNPDVIYSIDSRGGMIAAIMQDSFNSLNVSLCGATYWKDRYTISPELDNFEVIEDAKVIVAILKMKPDKNIKNILIVDEMTVTGNNLEKVREIFVERMGFDRDRVKTCVLLASQVSILNNRKPDYFYKICDTVDFSFPWGKAK